MTSDNSAVPTNQPPGANDVPPQPCAPWEQHLRGMHPRTLSARVRAAFDQHLPQCPECSAVAWDHYAAQAALRRLRPSTSRYPMPAALLDAWAAADRSAAGALSPTSARNAAPEASAPAPAPATDPTTPDQRTYVQASLFDASPTVAVRRTDDEPAIIITYPNPEHPGAPTRLVALFGFELTSMRSGNLPDTVTERISQQTLLLTRFDTFASSFPPTARAIELRYVAWPAARDNDFRDTIACYLLGRLDAAALPPADLLKRAADFQRQVGDVLAHVLPGYAFAPLAREPLARALQPFDIADTAELRPRSAPGASDVALPFLGVPDAESLVDMLLCQPAPVLLSICAGPTILDDSSLATGLSAVATWDREAAVATAERTRDVLSARAFQLQHLAALGRRAFDRRIQLASAAPLGDSLAATAAGEFGGPGRLTAQATWQDPTLPLASGAELVRPRSTPAHPGGPTEYALALDNLRTLGVSPWGDAHGHAAIEGRRMADLGEMARIFALPTTAPWLQDRGSALALPFSAGVSQGSRLGLNAARRLDRPVLLPAASRPFHSWIVGQTGTGKSTLLETLILQDIFAGRGVVAIDPHGDLIRHVLGKIPAERMQDVILFDPADGAYPVAINPLEAAGEEQQALVVSAFIGLLRKLFDPQHTGIVGPRFEHAVRNGLLTVMSNPAGGTLIEFMRCFTDDAFVKTLLPHVTDPLVRRYWTDQIAHTADFHKSEVLDYVVSKFGPFVTDFTIRRIIGQTRSSFSFREALDGGKIVLMSLAKGKLGSTNANFLGLILLPMILHAALSRADLPPSQRRETSLYVDEFHNYETDSLALMLAEARKYQLALTLANQHLGQLTGDVRDALMGNVGNVIAFRLGIADAPAMEHILAPSPVTARDLVALPSYVAYGRLLIDGRRTPAFTLQTEQVTIPYDEERAARIREYSRALYGTERAKVDDQIRRRANL